MTESNKSLNQIIKYRLDKLSKVYDHGVDPYPQKFDPKHNNNEIVCDFINFERAINEVSANIVKIILSVRGKSSHVPSCELLRPGELCAAPHHGRRREQGDPPQARI